MSAKLNLSTAVDKFSRRRVFFPLEKLLKPLRWLNTANFRLAENGDGKGKEDKEEKKREKAHANGLATLLQKKDWTGFAKRYNGPSCWRNHYDVKLAEQYQRFSSGWMHNLEMRTAQVALLFLSYAPGKIDVVIGPRTRAAIKNFRIALGLGTLRSNLPALV
jgi:hypothetical protein